MLLALRGNAISAFCDTSAAGVPILGGFLAENARRGSTPSVAEIVEESFETHLQSHRRQALALCVHFVVKISPCGRARFKVVGATTSCQVSVIIYTAGASNDK